MLTEGFPACIRAEPETATLGDFGLVRVDAGDGAPADVDIEPENDRAAASGEDDNFGDVAPTPAGTPRSPEGELAGALPEPGLTGAEPELDDVRTTSGRTLNRDTPAVGGGTPLFDVGVSGPRNEPGRDPSCEGVGESGARSEPGLGESKPAKAILCAGTGLAVPKLLEGLSAPACRQRRKFSGCTEAHFVRRRSLRLTA